MKIELEQVLPMDIEKKSFEIITKELGDKILDADQAPIIKRVIHTTADFDYADNLLFSDNVVENIKKALKRGACIVTDTQMVRSGINKTVLEQFGGQVYCFMSDEDVAKEARLKGSTRAAASMDRAAFMAKEMKRELIFAIGNAPTALVRLYELIQEGQIKPAAIIGVPVGFVNVVQSKELIRNLRVPYIVASGRKGGSNVAAAICNAILYMMDENRGVDNFHK